MYKILFFGPPGAGKGTQAKILSVDLNIPHLSTGDILRSKIQEEDNLALELKDIIAKGMLVSDNILNKIVSEKLLNNNKNGFILDGYPRTIKQSNFLENFLENNSLKIDFVFSIALDFEMLKKRITKRSQEEKRDDDNISVLETRYAEYNRTTKHVSNFYKDKLPQNFHQIDGNDQIEEITSKIRKILQKSWFSPKIPHFYTWLVP